MVQYTNQNLKESSLIESRSKPRKIKSSFFLISYFSFVPLIGFFIKGRQLSNDKKEEGDGIVIDYELVKINNQKSHRFYKISSQREFLKMLYTEWSKEWDKANNCKDKVMNLN